MRALFGSLVLIVAAQQTPLVSSAVEHVGAEPKKGWFRWSWWSQESSTRTREKNSPDFVTVQAPWWRRLKNWFFTRSAAKEKGEDASAGVVRKSSSSEVEAASSGTEHNAFLGSQVSKFSPRRAVHRAMTFVQDKVEEMVDAFLRRLVRLYNAVEETLEKHTEIKLADVVEKLRSMAVAFRDKSSGRHGKPESLEIQMEQMNAFKNSGEKHLEKVLPHGGAKHVLAEVEKRKGELDPNRIGLIAQTCEAPREDVPSAAGGAQEPTALTEAIEKTRIAYRKACQEDFTPEIRTFLTKQYNPEVVSTYKRFSENAQEALKAAAILDVMNVAALLVPGPLGALTHLTRAAGVTLLFGNKTFGGLSLGVGLFVHAFPFALVGWAKRFPESAKRGIQQNLGIQVGLRSAPIPVASRLEPGMLMTNTTASAAKATQDAARAVKDTVIRKLAPTPPIVSGAAPVSRPAQAVSRAPGGRGSLFGFQGRRSSYVAVPQTDGDAAPPRTDASVPAAAAPAERVPHGPPSSKGRWSLFGRS